ncbi:MAG: hypothetical protein JWM80_5466 [Cyanobacteria bacterium RYN_339]|nr:hypothetical protein [Cyanobacteria bacterium RYN_339]
MHKLLIAAVSLFLTACAKPAPTLATKPVPTLATGSAYTPHLLGETLALPGLAEGTIKLTNTFNGLTRTIPIASSTTGLTLDAATLPGFRPDAKVQEFQAEVSGPRGGGSSTFIVVTEPGAVPFPVEKVFYQLSGPMPASGPLPTPGPGAWASADSTSGPEAYIQLFLTKWSLEGAAMTHETVDRRDVAPPSFLKTVPDATKFVRYEIKGSFPKYLVPKEFSSSGQADVYTPASLSILLTQTDPADLVSLTAQ